MRPTLKDVLEMVAQYEVHQRDLSRTRNLGDVETDRQRIRIHKHLSLREKLNTLIHEALHAYYFDMGHRHSERTVVRDTNRLMREIYGQEYGK